MSCHVNYCAQCKQIGKDGVGNCRWLNFSFCHLNCLKRFYSEFANKCDLCEKQLGYKRIHLRDDVKNKQLLTFVCDECFDQRKQNALKCFYCANVCYKGYGIQKLTTTGHISKYVCSDECKILSTKECGRVSKPTVCSVCELQRKCTDICQDGHMYAVCSICVETFVRHGIKFGILLLFSNFIYFFRILFYFSWIQIWIFVSLLFFAQILVINAWKNSTRLTVVLKIRFLPVQPVTDFATKFVCIHIYVKILKAWLVAFVVIRCNFTTAFGDPLTQDRSVQLTVWWQLKPVLNCSCETMKGAIWTISAWNVQRSNQNQNQNLIWMAQLKVFQLTNQSNDSHYSNKYHDTVLDDVLLDRSIATASDQVTETEYEAQAIELAGNETMISSEFYDKWHGFLCE